jgi:hypothetical protein
VVAIFLDDCQGSALFSPSGKLLNLVIKKHRHLAKTKDEALDFTLMFACQSYMSNLNDLPKSIRTYPYTCLKNKNLKELFSIADEVAGETTQEEIFHVHKQAITDPREFLFIDLLMRPSHPSMLGQNMNEVLTQTENS